jgi:hypothetical protein
MASYTPVAHIVASPPPTDKERSSLKKVVIKHLSDRTTREEFVRVGYMRLQVTRNMYTCIQLY